MKKFVTFLTLFMMSLGIANTELTEKEPIRGLKRRI